MPTVLFRLGEVMGPSETWVRTEFDRGSQRLEIIGRDNRINSIVTMSPKVQSTKMNSIK